MKMRSIEYSRFLDKVHGCWYGKCLGGAAGAPVEGLKKLLDVNDFWIHVLPNEVWMRVIYFVISYLLICIGIALSNRCGLPIIPTDLFPRELSEIIKVKYSKIKVSFDVICLMITACMTGLILGHINGLGIGTVMAAFTMGKVIGLIGDEMDKHFRFVNFTQHCSLHVQ